MYILLIAVILPWAWIGQSSPLPGLPEVGHRLPYYTSGFE